MNAADAKAEEDFQEVVGDEIGFQDVATKGTTLRVSQPWPEDQLPSTTASLLSIASNKGLVAVAGSDGLHISRTEKTRRRYIPRPEGNDSVRPLEPDVTLSVPRISHVTFNADESCLIIAAQEGGGLAIYDTNQLANGAPPAFQIGTNNTSVRELLPNPNPSSELSHLVGIVLTDGKLILADLKNRTLVNNANGNPVFYENVYAASWSKLGKQLVAGLADSTAVQIDAQGNVKGQIPQPPQLQQVAQEMNYENVQRMPITSISWLSTYEFFIVYSPTYAQADGNQNDSLYFIAARAAKGEPLVFRRFSVDPCGAFDMSRGTPAHHFVRRINDWHKASDLLIVASTASTDVNALGQFKEGAKEFPANEFVTCTPSQDNRRIQLPMSAAGGDTSPLGLAIDLSTKEVAPFPVPSEDDVIHHSGLPLPALYVLNTDGILNIWWIVYNDAIREKQFCPGIVHRSGRYALYRKFAQELDAVPADVEGRFAGQADNKEPDETEPLGDPAADSAKPAISTGFSNGQAAMPLGSTIGQQPQASAAPTGFGFGSSSFPKPASSPAVGRSSFAQNGTSGAASFGSSNPLGQKPNLWGSSPSVGGAKPSFGSSSAMGSGPSAWSTQSTGAFPQPAALGQAPAFAKPSTPGQTPGFAKASPIGFGQPSQPGSGFGQVSQMGANKPSLFSGAKPASQSIFGQSNTTANGQQSSPSQNPPSPFAAVPLSSPFMKKPSLPNETSMGSTATLGSGSSGLGSFAQASGQGSSFASKPAVSRESTMGGPDEAKQPASGLSGLGSGGFKLGSGFQGDGSAKDDLPKPKAPGDNLFGSGFSATLGSTSNEPQIKAEPGTEGQPSLQQIPAAKEEAPVPDDAPLPPDPSQFKAPAIPDDAPLPPDPSTFKAPAVPDDAPLPPDPSTYKAPKMPDDIPGMPGFGVAKPEEKDVPIAGSPPVDVTNSQTFSPAEGSEADGPAEGDEDDDLEEESGPTEDDEDWDDEDEEDDDDEEEEEEEEAEQGKVDDPARHAAFMKRVEPPPHLKSPKSPPAAKEVSRTPSSDEKTDRTSYTPAGLPKGPVFAPPTSRTQQSPRSPSPQRAVTSPVRGPGIPEKSLPSQIQTSAVPPAKPVKRPAARAKPREPTAGELEDEAIARVETLLAAPIEPSKDFPFFYTHTDYTGAVEHTGIGGQIERVFRDVNSMIHTVGLNARSLDSFLQGQELLKKPGERTVEDLDDADAWCLGDLPDLSKLLENIGKQLEDGKLEDVRNKLENISEEQSEALKLKAKTTEMRKQIQAHTDPTQVAMRDAAPLSAETQAQQAELRQGVQRVQTLLSEVEQKMSMLRADLAALSRKDGQKNGAPVPTVEAVTNTILKMTAMVQQKSADIDILEAQIKRLPNGMASLRLDDDYEDDLASRLADNRLLTNRSSPAATPPRRPRMAANGDPLGMSGMFGMSRFQTPPSNRRSTRFTPEASGLGRSTGSLGASTRKKMSEVTTEEVDMYQSRVQRRAKVLGALKAKVEYHGPKIVRVE
ncbi:hypothetical protein PRZ48_011949 [Zasmidium cellare]|uniref:Nucleoporin Nup159/Nup146 N-terminal domain-containing protein n=1 Tax=Zasmidium cellare TaxID=395010 RepID=A0ABR0E8B4_ZASCE|nr:hypothetical protein PRZ48_011949 [Zasmidium cellare]